MVGEVVTAHSEVGIDIPPDCRTINDPKLYAGARSKRHSIDPPEIQRIRQGSNLLYRIVIRGRNLRQRLLVNPDRLKVRAPQ